MKVGIIGCGKIAQTRHIPEYTENPNTEIVAYYDLGFKRAESLACRYGGKAYQTVDELLENDEIEAVSICTANNVHAEMTLKALRAGKHVLCEKPMAVTYNECISMEEMAKKTGLCLMIGQNQRFTKAHIRAKKMIEQGKIGKVLTFRTTFGHSGPETWSVDAGSDNWFFDRKRAVMGAMADLGVHKTDLIQFLLNDHIVETTARMFTLDKTNSKGEPIKVDDNAICIYRMKSGVVGTMTASWTYYGEEDNSTYIYGTEGIMKIYADPKYSIEIEKRNNEKEYYDIDTIQTNESQTKSGVIDAFVNAVINGLEPPADAESVLSAMKAVFASIESSEQNRTVTIN